MDVNSAFMAFFNKRWVRAHGIPFVMLVIFFIASSFTELLDRDLRAKQVNLIIRQIGHQLLLQAGDSTSRVLPVTEIKKGTFLLQLENEFDFSHDSLMVLSQALLPQTQFPAGYTVTVHECTKASIVYGFQFNNTSPDILACRGRRSPLGCYTIEFTFPDFYENVEHKKADTNLRIEEPKPFKVDSQEDNLKLEESKITTLDNDIDQRTEELNSSNVDPQEVNPKPKEFKTTTFDYPLVNLVYSGMLMLGFTLLIGRFGKILTPVRMNNQDAITLKESVPELTALGKFLFDMKGQRLLLDSVVISLTDKECKILELLHKNFGELILRETLMQEVWINEGVITGRSLDMFVSKLRKKLSSDPELKITNVHGKGYKLEIHEIQIL